MDTVAKVKTNLSAAIQGRHTYQSHILDSSSQGFGTPRNCMGLLQYQVAALQGRCKRSLEEREDKGFIGAVLGENAS